MFHALRHREHHWLAWLAALAVLLGALAPTVSRWVQASGGAAPLALLEICVSREGGPSSIVLRGADVSVIDDVTQPVGHTASIDHCPFCLMQGDGQGMVPPPAKLAWLPASPLREPAPPLFLNAPRPLHAWASVLARAPPALSV